MKGTNRNPSEGAKKARNTSGGTPTVEAAMNTAKPALR